ncbi:MFS transporter [Streptomyces sp. Ru73]|uniref:MFS transporter n=1 Tax=Streptomyces sp. Ru73 TaxID=2080748 RepID=UPI000CDDC7C7|nr:MFS transporter [Streptomyces sp. Ru73]POX42505.1 MFS transporter [Streptomyces sp. Ru73]
MSGALPRTVLAGPAEPSSDGRDARAGSGRGTGTAWHVAVVTTLTSMPVFLPGAADSLICRELHWHTGTFGALLAVYWLGSLLGATASRSARAPVAPGAVVAGALLATAAALAAGAAVPGAGLWAGAVLGGCVYGFSQPYTNALLMRRCPPGVQGRAFGLKQAAVPAATLLCSVAVPVFAVPLGWRAVFAGGAAVCGAYGAVLLARVRRERAPERRSGPRGPVPWHPRLLALAAAGLLGAAIGNSLGGFLVLTLEGDGFSLGTAGFLAAGSAGLSVLARLGAGWLTDRAGHRTWRLLGAMFAVGTVGTALLAGGDTAGSAVGAFLAYAGGWGWAGVLHHVAGAAYPGREKQATAVTQMGVSLGAAAGPFAFGRLYEQFSGGAWTLLSAAGMAAVVCVVAARRGSPV